MSALPPLEPSDFGAFFRALHGVDPFPWQSRLSRDLTEAAWFEAETNAQRWPAAMALPTASGKTACIDIALFHLALEVHLPPAERTAPRRIFFCVDRRVIVDEAYERAVSIASKLRAAASRNRHDDPLSCVAQRLQHLAGGVGASPLAVFQLRGGTFHDDAWAASPLEPAVICTTVDQLGSRLLFRGYGVSPRSTSIHAGLAANDALILLDEAHCAEPFRQTLEAVRLFRGEKWAEQPLRSPFAYVEMSATPRSDAKPFVLGDQDDEQAELLKQRLSATKPARLIESECKRSVNGFAEALAQRAEHLANQGSRRIAVMVNRVDTANAVFENLKAAIGDPADEELAETPLKALMIGRMRPLDRDELTRRWQPYLRASADRAERAAAGDGRRRPLFVVATQCLEVGANLDFDALVTEAASLDALRQRFGRLNRLGRDDQCRAEIVAAKDALDANADDPIYGPAIVNTWKWLSKHAQRASADNGPATEPSKPKKSRRAHAAVAPTSTVDFGIAAMGALLTADPPGRDCDAPAADAPVMLPAHLDLWCQTAPLPDPDPDVSIFLHGPQCGVPTVSVCWRADLGDDQGQWADIVALLPPSSPECMPVPLHLMRQWIRSVGMADDTGDVEQAAAAERGGESRETSGIARSVLRWRGMPRDRDGGTRVTDDPDALRPGDVIVIPAREAHTCTFGHLPDVPTDTAPSPALCARLDRAEQANLIARHRGLLRLHDGCLRPPLTESVTLASSAPPAADWISATRALLLAWNPEEPPDEFFQSLKTALAKAPQPSVGAESRDAAAARDRIAYELSQLSASRLARSATAHPAGGLVLSLPGRVALPGNPEQDSGSDDADNLSIDRSVQVSLEQHTRSVREKAAVFTRCLSDGSDLPVAVAAAALCHDLGKLDPRWQAMIRGGQPLARIAAPAPLAKGKAPLRTPVERRTAALSAELPDGFRHEMLSMQIAQQASCQDGEPLLQGLSDELRDLVLHLIASHHGHARPFAPVVIDYSPADLPAFEMNGSGGHEAQARLALASVPADRRLAWEQVPAHRLDSGVCDRFWTLSRRFGWWGLAYVEALLRLADRAVSREEQECSSSRES